MGREVKPFKPGDKVSNLRRKLETVRGLVSPIRRFSGGRGITVGQHSTGVTVSALNRQSSRLASDIVSMFFAQIVGNEEIENARFAYAWDEIRFSGTSAVAVVSPGRFGTPTLNPAYNLAEFSASPQYQGDVDIDGIDYPAGFRSMPIGGGGTDTTHRNNTPVIMYEVITTGYLPGTEEPSTIYVFGPMKTSHDGTCA